MLGALTDSDAPEVLLTADREFNAVAASLP